MRKLDNLQKKLDMWQRTATMYGSINVTLTPSDVVQLHQDVAVLYARIAELEEAQRWIPLSERLPEFGDVVLVCDSKGYVKKDFRYDADGKWMLTDFVRHWMPLPEAPKEREE